MGVVDEEVKGVQHLFVISHQRHLQVGVHRLPEFGLRLVLLVDQLDLALLVLLLQQKVGVAHDLVRLLHHLLELIRFF